MLSKEQESSDATDIYKIGPINVLAVTKHQALKIIDDKIASQQKLLIGYANTNLINFACSDREIRENLESFLMLNDGIGMDIANYLLRGKAFPENLNGTDFTPFYMKESKIAKSVYLLGSTPESVKGASEKFKKMCDIEIAGYIDGYSCWDLSPDDLVKEINKANPDILLVAFGNPKQELWMKKNRESLNVPVIFGIGALFDFTSGIKKRCPVWMQKAKIEWLHRLISEPTRLGETLFN